MERGIRELKKNEAESTNASQELLLFIENILVSEVMDRIDWGKYSLCCYDPDTDKDKLMKEK